MEIHGDSRTRSRNGEVESQMHVRAGEGGGPRDADLEELAAGARRRLDELADRASSFAGRLRDSARDRLDRAGATVEERTGLVEYVRGRPLTALGIVFAAGFLAGFASPSQNRHWALERARRRARSLIVGGLTAAIAQEIRSIVDAEGGFGQLFASLREDDDLEEMENLEAPEDEEEIDA